MSESKKITSLMKSKFGVTRVNKVLKIKSTDNLYQVFNKTSKYIYQMGLLSDDWTLFDYENAVESILKFYYPGKKMIYIEPFSSDKLSDHEKRDIHRTYGFKEKDDQPNWKDTLFITKLVDENTHKSVKDLIIVDPQNSKVSNHQLIYSNWYPGSVYGDNENSWLNSQNLDGTGVFNANLLLGNYKLATDIKQNLNMNVFGFKLLKMLQISNNRSSKYAYLFTYNEAFMQSVKNKTGYFDEDGDYNWNGGICGPRTYQQLVGLYETIPVFMSYLKEVYSISLQQAYEDAQAGKSHAKFFQQKKNINQSTREEMNRLSNDWNQWFAGVEIDNDVDLDKLHKLAPEIEATVKALPKGINDSKPILRFRKLGNHKALGMFTNFNNTLAVDFRKLDDNNVGIQSFIHEYGHFLDFNTKDDELLSLSKDFQPILSKAQDYTVDLYKKATVKPSLKLNYLLTPTEVFARAFEAYVSLLGLDNSLIEDKKNYLKNHDVRYGGFKIQQQDVIDYFDKQFPTLRKNIESLVASQSETSDKSTVAADKVQYHVQKPKANKINVIPTHFDQLDLFSM